MKCFQPKEKTIKLAKFLLNRNTYPLQLSQNIQQRQKTTAEYYFFNFMYIFQSKICFTCCSSSRCFCKKLICGVLTLLLLPEPDLALFTEFLRCESGDEAWELTEEASLLSNRGDWGFGWPSDFKSVVLLFVD